MLGLGIYVFIQLEVNSYKVEKDKDAIEQYFENEKILEIEGKGSVEDKAYLITFHNGDTKFVRVDGEQVHIVKEYDVDSPTADSKDKESNKK